METTKLATDFNGQMEQNAAGIIQSRAIWLVVLGVIIVLITLAAGAFIGRQTMKSLNSTIEMLESVAEGDLRQRRIIDSEDELGRMGVALAGTWRKRRGVVRKSPITFSRRRKPRNSRRPARLTARRRPKRWRKWRLISSAWSKSSNTITPKRASRLRAAKRGWPRACRASRII
jgi:hypothetical protein